jgi:hypothetical protein
MSEIPEGMRECEFCTGGFIVYWDGDDDEGNPMFEEDNCEHCDATGFVPIAPPSVEHETP